MLRGVTGGRYLCCRLVICSACRLVKFLLPLSCVACGSEVAQIGIKDGVDGRLHGVDIVVPTNPFERWHSGRAYLFFFRLLAQVVPKVGIEVVNVDMNDLDAVRRAIDGGPTTMVMLESPTNPRLQITDIRSISNFAHAKGALVCVDNSIMAPVFQAPLDLGADICMTSATKFISGQSDVTGGILACRGEQLGKDIYFHQNAEGLHLGPFDCWLALRGLKTMALRMERQAENAMVLARWLEAHPLVKYVNYPGLESNAGYDLHKSQASGAGSILSFATGDVELSRIIVEQAKLFKITVSFGNTASLISLPCFMSHASIPAEVRAARGLPDDLVRISAGIGASRRHTHPDTRAIMQLPTTTSACSVISSARRALMKRSLLIIARKPVEQSATAS